jgi:hypothetical protein
MSGDPMTSKVLAVFQGVTTPVEDLAVAIQNQGWQLGQVRWDTKLNAFTAEAISPHGEKLSKFGPDAATAVANALLAVTRRNHMRTTAQFKVGMWRTNWHERLPEIAEAYRDAPIYDPKAVAAWKALGDDSVHRLAVLAGQLHVEPTNEPQPYASADDMRKDVHEKRHYYLTRAGTAHPVWTSDQTAAFRAVHDILGHGVAGGHYDWPGRNLAAAAHAPLLEPLAQQALFAETVGRQAFLQTYGHGPQKVALFPEFVDHHQSENNPSAHRGIHPSQTTAPVAVPQPFKLGAFGSTIDVNKGWSSGVDPLPQNAYIHHGDPMQAKATMDNASLIDTGWSKFQRGDGSDDRDRMKLAVVNAFRTVLLSPRKDLRWNAIHYQDIAHIPGTVDDPKVYWDALENSRRSWNEKQGIDPNSHMIYFKFLKPFEAAIAAQHPEKGWEWAKKEADQTLFNWWTEEQERIQEEDSKKPADKQRHADEIERRANEALARRMQLFLKPKSEKHDVEDTQMSMFGSDQWKQHLADLNVSTDPMGFKIEGAGGQYNVLTGEEGLKYGAFMGTHLKAIAQISQHADEILDAALEDVRNHDGEGHHFRHAVLALGVSGVGPKVCSFAWLLLQPLTSQLATIDTHMMDVLGHDYEKEMNNRDYFKFEREFRAGLDAAGYAHLPLGSGQWGMWDYKRTGPGSHQDHSAMRVLDPKPHAEVDWVGKAVNLKGESWHNQAPDWWQNTQPARDQIAQEWDQTYGKNFPRTQVPYQDLGTTASVKESYDHPFSFYWDRETPVGASLDSKARTLAEYATADDMGEIELREYVEDHKSDTRLSDEAFKRFKKKLLHKFDRLSKVAGPADNAGPVPSFIHPETKIPYHGMPGQGLMEHARLQTGLSTQEVWRLLADEHVHKG